MKDINLDQLELNVDANKSILDVFEIIIKGMKFNVMTLESWLSMPGLPTFLKEQITTERNRVVQNINAVESIVKDIKKFSQEMELVLESMLFDKGNPSS